jgi:tRNA(fMet)-specific endonuclease VapC
MTYLLDSSVIIDLLRHKKSVYDFIANHEHDTLVTSWICAFEIFCGIWRTKPPQRSARQKEFSKVLNSLSDVIPFEEDQADKAGELHALLSKKGTIIDDVDILIAACALTKGATIFTENAKHFTRIPGLTVVSI